jgi:hypothetical protein
MTGCEGLLDISGNFSTAKIDITTKVVGILRQRYPECKVASKVLRRPLPKMSL